MYFRLFIIIIVMPPIDSGMLLRFVFIIVHTKAYINMYCKHYNNWN